ncbi:unnamed protein product [Prorocentrum cordatum]|uniref:Uncharacterized protein n=1 Tax=Prorocentrum cordatum TaxID=2364126 RepID=A0ABN9XD68_9DINO|nr:unnamed protein product [Polarella glacialis]
MEGAQTALKVSIIKFFLQSGQLKRDVEEVIFGCFLIDADSHEAMKMSRMEMKCSEGVATARRRHERGLPHLGVFGGLLMGSMERKGAVGSASAKMFADMCQLIETMGARLNRGPRQIL